MYLETGWGKSLVNVPYLSLWEVGKLLKRGQVTGCVCGISHHHSCCLYLGVSWGAVWTKPSFCISCSFILIWQVCFLDFGVAVPSSASFRVVGGARLTVSKSLRHSGVFNGLHFQCRALNRTSREPFSILVVAGHMLAIKSWNTELQRRWYRILELYRIINKVR